MNIKKEKLTRATAAAVRAASKPKVILNDSKKVEATVLKIDENSKSNQIISIAKSKSDNNKDNKSQHYVLQKVKGGKSKNNEEKSPEDDLDYEINFILTEHDEDEPTENADSTGVGDVTTEVHISGDELEDKSEEMAEHVCGKCFKNFRRFNGLKKHLDFCTYDSGYHLRKTEMLKNLDKIEKDSITMENKDICFCCGESYDTCHLGHINCPDCPKSFKSQMTYERHVFISHSETDDYACTICNAKLRSENFLKLHIEQHQNRGKPFACKICGRDFTRPYHLKRHQMYSACNGGFEKYSMNCKVCNKVFYRLDNLRSHLKTHLGDHVGKKPEYMCPVCKNCFYSMSTLNIHTRIHTGERPFGCDLCEKKFPSLVALKKHRRYHTGEKPYSCSTCSMSFAVKEVLNRHMKTHTGERPHKCPDCGKGFIQAVQLRSHAKTHLRPFPCNNCEEKFKTAKQLERHTKKDHSSRKRKREDEYKCDICEAYFRKESQLRKHMEQGNHITYVKERTDCAICDKNFDSNKTLQFHILKVHEVDPDDILNDNPPQDVSSSSFPKPKIYKISASNDNEIELINTSIKKDTNISKDSNNSDENNIVVGEYIIDELPTTSNQSDAIQTIMVENEQFTIIPLELDDAVAVDDSSDKPKLQSPADKANNKVKRKSLAASLAAAIADKKEVEETQPEEPVETFTEEDLKMKDNVGKLLDMLVDTEILENFGWPLATEEIVLCKVIENCGHDLSQDAANIKDCDFTTRMREYLKLLFTVVIHNESIKELLNNFPIDDVIEYVLGNDDDDEDDDSKGNGEE